MVASTNSNGIGRTLMQTEESPILQNQIHSRRFSNSFQSFTNESLIVKESFECQQCGKTFGNQQILQLHTRLHESQSLLRGIPGAAATLTQCNGTLSFNFNITIDISSEDENGTILRDRLTNILNNESLWENVTHSIAKIKDQSETEKKTVNVNSNEKDQCQTQTDSELHLVTDSIENSTDQSERQNTIGNISPMCSKTEDDMSQKKEKDTDQPAPSPIRTQPITRGKKVVGLTKIRMEDCRRCDECSCIYMDERDYIKHMKNFHKHDISNLQLGEKGDLNFRPFRHKQDSKRQRQSPTSPLKKCRSCCKQCKCKGNHDTLQPMLPILRPILGRQPNRLQTASEGELPSDIKDRWNKVVTQRLSENVCSTSQNDSDIGHLLSQVEVKIKTEPTDLNLSGSVADETEYFPHIKQEVGDVDMFEY